MNNQAHDHYHYFVIQSQNLFIFFSWWGFSDILYPINHTPVARIITSETSHTVRWKEEAFSSPPNDFFIFLRYECRIGSQLCFINPEGGWQITMMHICSASCSCLPGGFFVPPQVRKGRQKKKTGGQGVVVGAQTGTHIGPVLRRLLDRSTHGGSLWSRRTDKNWREKRGLLLPSLITKEREGVLWWREHIWTDGAVCSSTGFTLGTVFFAGRSIKGVQ